MAGVDTWQFFNKVEREVEKEKLRKRHVFFFTQVAIGSSRENLVRNISPK